MNTPIFDRSTLPITVTEKGKEIVAQCENIINQVEGMIAPFKRKKSI